MHRPVFLVGTVRSGSTLVARSLGAHPEVFYAGFELSAEWNRHAGIPISCPDTEEPHCPSLGPGDVDDRARRDIERHLAGLLAVSRKPGARILNKNPHFWNKLRLLRSAFPDAALIVTTRDIRSTVASTKRLWQWLADNRNIRHYLPDDATACWECIPPRSTERLDERRIFPGGDIQVLASYWLRCHERIDRDRECFQTRRCVRHRDFVASPQGVLDELRRALDLGPGAFELPTAIDPGRNELWHERLTRRERSDLDMFIDANRVRIEGLRYADTTL